MENVYVSQRYEIEQVEGRLVAEKPHVYTANTLAHYNHKTKRLEAVRGIGLAASIKIAQIGDKAQESLLDFTLTTSDRIGIGSQSINRVPVSNRMLFIQASIGTGKSTLLCYFSRCVAPAANESRTIPVSIYCTSANLNSFSVAKSEEEIWPKILKRFRSNLPGEFRSFDTTDGWLEISRPHIEDADGKLRPEVALHPKGKAHATNAIAHQCRDDLVFLQRLTQHLAIAESATLVFVMDNIDRQQPRLRQLTLIDFFTDLLNDIPEAIGIISVRESTLGSLGQLDKFAGYLRVSSLHLTAPVIGDIIQNRIDHLISEMQREHTGSLRLSDIKVGAHATLTLPDIVNFLKHVRTAFKTTSNNLDQANHDLVPRVSIERFLPYANHSNIRGAVSNVATVLESWALNVDSIISQYVWQRDNNYPIKLPPLTTDEFIRVGSVGRYRYYDHTLEPEIFNVYSVGRTQPDASSGRFPLLLIYRVFEYFMKSGRRDLADALDVLSCFGFSRAETSALFQTLINWLFLESPDSAKLDEISLILRTKKLEYYYSTLCVNMTYVESVRNDCVIEYQAQPHEVRSSLDGDVLELCKFAWYVLEQETKEYAFIASRGTHTSSQETENGHLLRYRRIVKEIPLSARMCKSFCLRYSHLNAKRKSGSPKRSLAAWQALKRLREEILERSTSGQIYQEVPINYLPIPPVL